MPKINLKTQFGRNCSSCSRQGHRAWILEVGHDHCRNGEHEAAHDLEKKSKLNIFQAFQFQEKSINKCNINHMFLIRAKCDLAQLELSSERRLEGRISQEQNTRSKLFFTQDRGCSEDRNSKKLPI